MINNRKITLFEYIITFLLTLIIVGLFVYFFLPPQISNTSPLINFSPTRDVESDSDIYFDANNLVYMSDWIEYFEDPYGVYTFDDILDSTNGIDFQALDTGSDGKHFSYSTKSVWVRFTVNSFIKQEPYLIESPLAGLIVDIWMSDGNGRWVKETDSISVEDKLFPLEKNIFTKFPMVYDDNQTFYLRLTARDKKRVYLKPMIKTYQNYINASTPKYINDAIYLGFIMMVVLYHLFLYHSVKEKYYLFYAIFIFSGMIYRLNNMDFEIWRIWQENFALGNVITTISHSVSMTFGILFFKTSLGFDTNKKIFTQKINKITKILIFLIFTLASFICLFNPVFTIYNVFISSISVLGMIGSLIYVITGIKQKNKTAILYLVGFTPIIIFAFLEIFNYDIYYILSLNYPYIDLIALGDIFQCLVFTIALGKEINNMVLDRTKDLNKVIMSSRKLQKEAEQSNLLKSRFIANISHELKTPLAAITGFAELLKREDCKQSDLYSDKIIKESDHLLNIIGDILDLTKVEEGKLMIENIPFKPREVFQDTLSFMKLKIEEKGLDLSTSFDPNIPPILIGDPVRLKQVLLNILQNSYKFTHKGYISASIKRLREDEKGCLLRIEISDSGIGISYQKQQNIFDSFVQADTSTTRVYGGTGLGTSISRKLVNLMGGEIGLNSKEGSGTLFWVEVPLQKGTEQEWNESILIEEEKPAGTSVHILFVDDYETNREIARSQIEHLGFTVKMAVDGLEAFNLAKIEKFDIILMDLQTPQMDGFTATEKIRENPGPNQNTPIIAVTAGSFQKGEVDFKAKGFQDCVYKPLRKSKLIKITNTWVFHLQDNPVVHFTEEKKDNSPDPIDLKEFLVDFNNKHTALMIIQSFIDNCNNQLFEIAQYLTKKEYDLIQREAHTIKGGALSICAKDLYSISFLLEQSCKKDKINQEEVRLIINDLKKSLQGLEDFIKKSDILYC